MEIWANRAYDRAAIKFRGVDADINFNISDYDEDMKQVSFFFFFFFNLKNSRRNNLRVIFFFFLQTKNLNKEEFVHVLRRQSSGISRGGSKLRGLSVQRYGRWETQMNQIIGNK